MITLEVPIGTLKGMDYQPETRTLDKNLVKLKSSIRDVGLLVPILIDKDNHIIDGHRRVAVFKVLGKDTIPAVKFNGELANKKSIDLYSDINLTQRKMSGLEQLVVYLLGGRIRMPAMMKAIEWTETHLGSRYLMKLCRRGFTPYYVVRLKSMAHKCGYLTDKQLKTFFDWCIKYNQFSQVMAIEKMKEDTQPIVSAVAENRPIKKVVTYQ